MTSAPPTLLAVRRLLLAHLDLHENSAAYPTDLDPAEVGIVGDAAHRGGYHCGADRVVTDDYSVVESHRDRIGLADWSCALDVGGFRVVAGGRTHDLASFSRWLVVECAGNAPDTRDIREVIYSPDGTTVRRWDRLRKRSGGDGSHRWHTHISFHRDAIKIGRDQTPVFRRYLTTIGLIKAPTPVEDDMDATDRAALMEVRDNLRILRNESWATTNRTDALLSGKAATYQITGEKTPRSEPNTLAARLGRIESTLGTMAGRDFTDEAAIVAGVLAGLSPAAIAAAIPTDLARQVADELAHRLQG